MDWLKKRILLLSIFDLYILPFSFFIISIFYLAYMGYMNEFILILLSSFGSVISVLLKFIFKKPRPDTFKPTHSKFGNLYSFPSSHTMLYFVFFSTWGYILATRNLFSPLLTFIGIFISFFVSTFIGVSRVAIGAHSKKDVVGGYFFGILYFEILVLVDILFLR